MTTKSDGARVGTGWQSIDSAPKDGTPFLAFRRGYCEICRYDSDEYARKPRPFWASEGPFGRAADRQVPPIAWQPLPALPSDGFRAEYEKRAASAEQAGASEGPPSHEVASTNSTGSSQEAFAECFLDTYLL